MAGEALTGSEKRRAAVLGSPIRHSLSPALHRAALPALGLSGVCYIATECADGALPALCGPLWRVWGGLATTAWPPGHCKVVYAG